MEAASLGQSIVDTNVQLKAILVDQSDCRLDATPPALAASSAIFSLFN